MAADANPPNSGSEGAPSSPRRGIGLCLSGGGFRATLFHTGVIQRLSELGVTGRPDFETVASVSGGSITAAQWAVAEARRGPAPASPIDFVRDVVQPLRTLTRRDIRTGAMAQKYLLPWNWFRGAFAVNNLVGKFEGAFGKGTLDLLPERPRFVFCGTDMAFGANFVFERDRVGSYLAGYAAPSRFTLAQAVAASVCFPPLFGPLRIKDAAEMFKGGGGATAAERRQILSDLRVTDGGVYDNLGLEPVWKNHRVVLVSDAGGLMDAEADKNFFWRIQRYQSIQETQARGVRKRFLISGFTQGTIGGAYVGVGSATSSYAAASESARSTPGPNDSYTKTFAMEVIRNIRTDLDGFSEVEQGVLMNHGYALIDAALRTHVPELMGPAVSVAAEFTWPAPEFAPTAMTETELRRLLAGASKRKLKGRG